LMKIRRGALMLKFVLIITILFSSVNAGKLEIFTKVSKWGDEYVQKTYQL